MNGCTVKAMANMAIKSVTVVKIPTTYHMVTKEIHLVSNNKVHGFISHYIVTFFHKRFCINLAFR